MLTLLILGLKSPSKEIDVYLRPLIDDLKVLWALKGVETINVATCQEFNMRVMVLWTINDFSARSSLSGWSGQGYKACPTCNEDTLSVRVLGKTAYVGHIRFLKKPYKWRRSLEFNGEIKDGDPSRKFDRDQIQAQLARLPTHVKGKHSSYGGVKIKRNQYLPDEVAKLIIELCSFFKQIYSETVMEDDMLKAQSKVVDILCNLELIYPPVFFDIMIHLVIHLPLEAFEGGLIRPRWMFPFERFTKKLKGYVRNKAKPKGSIAEGYVAEEALTFSEAFKDDQYILTTQVKQCFYLEDMARRQPHWKVVEHVNHKKFSDGGVIVVEEDPDVIHFDNSSDLPLSTSLNELDNATLHIYGQSTEVDTPPDIIDLDEDDDIIDDEDSLPHDLVDSDDEDLVNVDDDDGVDMSADIA
nr:hypothetical protein [Tanacetum cinerariifolium]